MKKNNKDFAIELVNVGKKYVIHHEKPTLVENILKNNTEEFWALKKINLQIKKGERLGIIGPNGSGKTTLLKIMTGITTPTTGSVKTNGKIISLIDLNAGFHNDLSGIENIYMNGMILGMTKSEIESKIKDIIKLANIGKFIDAPLFTYSSGMMLRLGFSIAIHSDPDILILDENISVGDQDFKQSSFNKIDSFLKENKTIVVASHDLGVVKRICNRVIVTDGKKILDDGPTKKVLMSYIKSYKN